jgi:WD40 repeat protein
MYEQPASIRRVAWSPDGALLACAGDDAIVYVLNASDGTLYARLAGHRGRVNDVAWSLDGKWLASGGCSRHQDGGGEIFLWDVSSGEREYVLTGHQGVVYAVAWDSTSSTLVSGGSDGVLCWWDVQREQCVLTRQAHQGTLQSLKVSPDGTRLATCGDDGAITIWDMQSAEHLRTLRRDRPYERLDITGLRGLTKAQKATLQTLGAIDTKPVQSTSTVGMVMQTA